MPTIFTSTPIEAHIISVFLHAQMQAASFMKATPVFRALLFIALLYTMVLGFVRIATHRLPIGQEAVRILYRVGLLFLALTLLGKATPDLEFASPNGDEWRSMPQVSSDTRYSQTLNASTYALHGYVFVHEALTALANTLVRETAVAFDDETLTRDPTFLPNQLARMSAMALGSTAEAAFRGLEKNCSRDAAPKIVGAYHHLSELYDLSNPGCQAAYTQFESAVETRGDELMLLYPQPVRDQMAHDLSIRFPGIDADGALKNMAIANAIAKSAVYANVMRPVAGAAQAQAQAKPNVNGAGAGGSPGDARPEETVGAFTRLFAAIDQDPAGASLGGSTRASRIREQFSERLNQLAPLLPSARGFLHGAMAVLFVVAAYSVGFGTWRLMLAWILADASLSMYRPIAVLGYKVADYFLKDPATAEVFYNHAASPYYVLGAKLLQNEIASIQTVYLFFEVGAFWAFALGALAAFRPMASLTSMAGTVVMSNLGAMAGRAYQGARVTAAGPGAVSVAAGGAAAAASAQRVTVNVHDPANEPYGGGFGGIGRAGGVAGGVAGGHIPGGGIVASATGVSGAAATGEAPDPRLAAQAGQPGTQTWGSTR